MPRRFPAIIVLLALQGGPLLVLARPQLRDIAHECRCTERLCHCPHKHRPPKKPDCHFPGGKAPGQLSFQSCENYESGVLHTQPWLLPAPLSAQPAEGIPFEVSLCPLRAHWSQRGPDPPPPRFLLPNYA